MTRALTIRQPWAWAIVHGGKAVENRGWKPRVAPGRIAVHAAARLDASPAWQFVGERAEAPFVAWEAATGAVIGTVDVVGFHERGSGCVAACATWGMDAAWHWVLADPRPLRSPVPCAGSLGLWELPADVAAVVSSARDRVTV